VTPTGKARAGFSLTEILMAVGILGIGMTMVASVFPVAVDQSRRSTDLTMAALSARSVAAILRARRRDATPWFRTNTTIAPAEASGLATPKTSPPLGTTTLPYEVASYNPASFLYDDSVKDALGGSGGTTSPKSPREYSNSLIGMYGMWNMGSYVPVVFATPINPDPDSTDPGKPRHGPWRVTILIYKSRGDRPGYLNQNPSSLWVWRQNPGERGSYVMDWRFDAGNPQGKPNNRGEAYLVQRHFAMAAYDVVVPAVAFRDARPGALQFRAFVAGGDQTEGTACYGTSNSVPAEWVSLPGAVAAYHTIIGD